MYVALSVSQGTGATEPVSPTSAAELAKASQLRIELFSPKADHSATDSSSSCRRCCEQLIEDVCWEDEATDGMCSLCEACRQEATSSMVCR